MSKDARECAIILLSQVLEKGAYSNRMIDKLMTEHKLEQKEQRLFTKLSMGTLERLLFLDAVIAYYSNVPFSKIKPVVRHILRISLYQIFFMDRIPPHAICNEAVRLTKKRGLHGLKGFVNALCRNAIRQRDEFPSLLFDDAAEELSRQEITYSMPSWIISMWQDFYGKEKTLDILNQLWQKSHLTVFAYTHKIDERELLQSWEKAGISYESIDSLHNAYRIHQGNLSLTQIPGFLEHAFYIQDESSMRAVEAASLQPKEHVLDLCAAPGGKSLYAMHLMEGSGSVELRDVSFAKENRVLENIQHSGFSNMHFLSQDGCVFDEKLVEKFDLVICDVPCSGLGVLASKPEIRYRLKPEDIDALLLVQNQILSNALFYVKPKGRLLYSTCTISPRENEVQIAQFLRSHPTLQLTKEQLIFPQRNGGDGFYYALLTRQG